MAEKRSPRGRPAGALLAAGIAIGAGASVLLLWMREAGPRPGARPGRIAKEQPAGAPLFTDITNDAGIRFRHTNGRTGKLYYPEIMGSGVALFDYDRDGDLDIYFVNGNSLERMPDPAVKSALYRNSGDATFTDVSEAAGVASVGYGQGACVGDYDADGDPDLYVTFFGANRLYQNNGDGSFREIGGPAGVAVSGWGQSCAFLDFDGDGQMDLYSLSYLSYSPERQTRAHVLIEGKTEPDYAGPQDYEGQASHLFRNLGNGRFEDVTKKAGLHRTDGKGMGLGAADYDEDGDVDLFVANDGTANFYFRNRGRGAFDEVGLLTGLAVSGDGLAKSSMGVDVADFDGDGRIDIVTPTVRREVFTLYRNDGTSFTDVSWERGLAEATARRTGFSGHFLDVDNDGDVDLFFTNGGVKVKDDARASDDYEARYADRDLLLANDGRGYFADVSPAAGAHFEEARIGRGAATGDLDNDGDLDLVINNLAGPAVVLRNDTKGGHWITLTIRGKGRLWRALGAKVRLEAGGRRQYAVLHGGGGYLGASDDRVHFGLGPAATVDRIEVVWPDGARKTLTAARADQFLEIAPE